MNSLTTTFFISEILSFNEELNNLIYYDCTLKKIKETAYKQGFTSLYDDAKSRVISGETSLEEILRVVEID